MITSERQPAQVSMAVVDSAAGMDDRAWLQHAREAFITSNSYFDVAVRNAIINDLRQFQGEFPSGSKYLSDGYRARSRFFRPKTRAMVRKNEAIAAEAYFQQQDVVNVTAHDPDDPVQLASAEINKELLQYRLTHSIPWFQILTGAYQDAQVQGIVCSYQYWEYNERKKLDRPCIQLKPIENIRFDPSASWMDPVNTSPYFIELMPMYVKDVMSRMKTIDGKTGQPKWRLIAPEKIQKACTQYSEVIRLQREQGRIDPRTVATGITAYSIVWVHRNIVEIDDVDYVYHTLGTEELLDTPRPIEQVYFHGKRPYVIGVSVVETHKQYPGGPVRLTKSIQAELNENANQRSDNVKFAMNKRYFVKRTGQVDLRSLRNNVPSSVTMMNNPKDGEDVRVVDTPDVTRSAYEEQDRLNLDFDDIAGGFSGSSVASNRKLNETVGGLNILTKSGSQIDGLQLRTFTETWAEPVLRQVMLLEQRYETDEVILAIAGKKAQLLQRFGVNTITDHLLMQELSLTVNVGVGATNPHDQLDNFLSAIKALRECLDDQVLVQYGFNVHEATKEIFGKLGYKDGERFFPTDEQDPRIAQLQQQVQQLQQALDAKHPPEMIAAQVKELEAKAVYLKSQTVKQGVDSTYAAVQAGEVIAAVPGVAPVADKVLQAAGWTPPEQSADPNLPTAANGAGVTLEPIKNRRTGTVIQPPGAVANTNPMTPAPPAQPASPEVGARAGIETQRPDGIR